MFTQKKGFFNRLLYNDSHDLICNTCSNQIEEAEFKRTNAGSLFISLGGGGFFSICDLCFAKGWKNYRLEEFHKFNSLSHDKCSICSSSFKHIKTEVANSKIFHICSSCVVTKGHPDNSHSFTDLNDSEAIWNHCISCGTLRIKVNNEYSYWIVGSSEKSYSSPRCTKHFINQGLCSHSYIDILDLRKEGKKISKSDVEKANKSLKRAIPILQNDPFPIITEKSLSITRNGYILQWCRKCGHVEKKV